MPLRLQLVRFHRGGDTILALHRLIRIVSNVLTVLALAMTALVAALWLRSHLVDDEMSYLAPSAGVRVLTNSGSLMVDLVTEDTSVFGRGFYYYSRRQVMRMSVSAYVERFYPTHALGFGFSDKRTSMLRTADNQPLTYTRERGVIFPLWAPTFVLAAIGGAGVFVWRRRRQRIARGRMHLCADCGYDLRASPERCPECGAAATLAPLK